MLRPCAQINVENSMHRTIEPLEDQYAVYEHSVYGSDSVLEGYPKRVFLAAGTFSELRTEYPEAEVLQHTTRQQIVLPETPPAWFDPTIAGETW